MKIILNINRQFIPTFVFLILSLTCYTQITFNKTIDINLGYDNAGIVKEDESGYLFIGNGWDFDFGGYTSLKLCKTDLEGNELWQKTFGEEGLGYDASHNYVNCGNTYIYFTGTISYVNNEANITLIKLDSENGDTLFVKEFIKPGFQAGLGSTGFLILHY